MEGKTALILEVDYSDGVGKAIIRRLTQEGYQCITGMPEGAIQDLKNNTDHLDDTNLKHTDIQLNNRDSIIGGISDLVSNYGSIDLLVVHTNYEETKTLAEIRPEDWENNLNYNLLGPFYIFQEIAPHMKGEGAGRIITIAPATAERNREPNDFLNATTGSGLCRLAESVANNLHPAVTVNTVLVGEIKPPGEDTTVRTRDASPDSKIKPLRPEDVAETIWYLSRRTSAVTGETIFLDSEVRSN